MTMIPDTEQGHLICAANLLLDAASSEKYRADTMASASYMLKPNLFIDGNQWCALYGDNLQDGVAGFGDSPEHAYGNFDVAWSRKLPTY